VEGVRTNKIGVKSLFNLSLIADGGFPSSNGSTAKKP
jgi:hypothetical protein